MSIVTIGWMLSGHPSTLDNQSLTPFFMSELLPRSLLFTPGTRPDRFAKAISSDADAVCLDLEDAVPMAEKPEARDHVSRFLESHPRDAQSPVAVRINKVRTTEGLEDLLHLRALAQPLPILIIPKAEAPADVDVVANVLGPLVGQCWAILESCEGIAQRDAIAQHPFCAALMFGSGDYSAEVGGTMEWDALLLARTQILQSATRAHKVAVDGVWPDIKDMAGCEQETRQIRALGFTARAAIHPAQIAAIHRGFAITQEERTRAEAIVQTFEASKGQAVLVQGVMVDRPIYLAAKRALAVDR